MINQTVTDYGLISVCAEADNDAVGFYQKMILALQSSLKPMVMKRFSVINVN